MTTAVTSAVQDVTAASRGWWLRARRWLGVGVASLVLFVFFLQWTFPFERVRDRLADAVAGSYVVSAKRVRGGWWPGSIKFEGLALQARPTKPDEVPQVLMFQELGVSVSMLGALGGKANVRFEGKLGGGAIEGEIAGWPLGARSGTLRIDASGKGVPLAMLPGVASAVGLPMAGQVRFQIGLDGIAVNKGKADFARARGVVRLTCPSTCTIGDGVTRIKPGAGSGEKNIIFAGEGLAVPTLTIDSFELEIRFEDGHMRLTKLEVQSRDGDAAAFIDIELGKNLGDSLVRGCIKFKLSEELKRREEKFGNVQALIGTAIDREGFSNIELFRTLKNMGRRPANSCDESSLKGGGSGGNEPSWRDKPDRPRLPPATATPPALDSPAPTSPSLAPAPPPIVTPDAANPAPVVPTEAPVAPGAAGTPSARIIDGTVMGGASVERLRANPDGDGVGAAAAPTVVQPADGEPAPVVH